MSIVLSRISVFQLTTPQKPFVGKVPPGPSGDWELTALPQPLVGLGKGPGKVGRRAEQRKGRGKRGEQRMKGSKEMGRERQNCSSRSVIYNL